MKLPHPGTSELAGSDLMSQGRRRFGGCIIGLLVVAVAGAAALGLLYALRGTCLVAFAQAWAVNEPVSQADVVVVLSGDPDHRPAAAAALWRDGVARRFLLTQVEPTWRRRLGLTPSDSELYLKLLESAGVSASSLSLVGDNVGSTWDEARAFRRWAETNDVSTAAVLTHAFHARRTRWIFRKELDGLGVALRVIGQQTPAVSTTNWWRTEQGLIMMQNEWIKYLYYRLKYR